MSRLFLDANIVIDLLEERQPFCNDALQYYSAVKAKADFIITRNGQDFTLSKIPVMTASEYLAMLK